MKPIPFPFVLDELAGLQPYTKPMFGCTAVYVREKIVLILRDKGPDDQDKGVWLATTGEHHASLGGELPSMRSIVLFGPGPTGWQVLPAKAADFEESVLRACALIRSGDPRIGKVPKARRPRKAGSAGKAGRAVKTGTRRLGKKTGKAAGKTTRGR